MAYHAVFHWLASQVMGKYKMSTSKQDTAVFQIFIVQYMGMGQYL